MTSSSTRWIVIVVDDSADFALRVWRYMNRSLGTDVVNPQRQPGAEGRIVPFVDGLHSFAWVRANRHWEVQLRPLVDQASDGSWRLLAIVDVVGEEGYEYRQVVKCLDEYPVAMARGSIECRLVSAYDAGLPGPGRVVLPKTRETLRELRAAVYPQATREQREPSRSVRHVLVTGAGFEIENGRGGSGLPATRELVEQLADPFEVVDKEPELIDRQTIYLVKNPEGFPRPTVIPWGQSAVDELESSGGLRNLDVYWDILLRHELNQRLGSLLTTEPKDRESRIAEALKAERRMREAFRAVVQRHDWGHLNQTVAATSLNWHAWLTTNYTRFADRALAALPGRWQVISTETEALASIRENDGEADPSNHSPSKQFLFKLHGDIGHLLTMAIAGYDKDIFSSLSAPVDSLYQVYAAAERYLRRSMAKCKAVVWHLVGHALGDRRLLELILRTCEETTTIRRNVFLVVNPQPNAPVEKLTHHLGRAAARVTKSGPVRTKFGQIWYRRLTAEEYMARLDDESLTEERSLDGFGEWFTNLPDGELERGRRVEKRLQARTGRPSRTRRRRTRRPSPAP